MQDIEKSRDRVKQQFMDDLQKIYDQLQERQAELNSYYTLIHGTHREAERIVELFLSDIGLERSDETDMAALVRIINLREDSLEQVLEKAGFNEDDIIVKKEKAYLFVSRFYLNRHTSLFSWIEEHQLLNSFYRTLISGVDVVGQAMSGWQSVWTSHIIHGINRDLYRSFNGNEEEIYEKLQRDGLYDLDENGCIGDRCYSVLHCGSDGDYRRVSYAEAFASEVAEVSEALDGFIIALEEEEDIVFNQKDQWIAYLLAMKMAFKHTHPDELIGYWADVDRAWMNITTPLQIGHPLEYYEDHYRKAVALEWDLRIINPKLQESSSTRTNIKSFAFRLAENIGGNAPEVIKNNLMQVEETQLYIGQPALYYGAQFNGLFSAQVVPNDEEVSSELGKKIFAYADFVLASKKAKPVMRLSLEVMGEEFVKKQKRLAEEESKLWHRVYDISTIGHEFGHILWIENDTESRMNVAGQFKNIEEFKATAGGLMAFFEDEDIQLKKHVIDDLVSRAVGLMAWREVGEVLPYYCEGLIHLELLFRSGAISYSETIQIDYSRYEVMKAYYQTAYKALVSHYLRRADAATYLYQYVVKEDGIYLPKDELVREFVEYYYKRYKEIGQESVELG
ncbi:MAG: invasion protein CiaB [Campylobacterota bacterium]|nr:invasion protein CiaB [Campylobacterota bacterium]